MKKLSLALSFIIAIVGAFAFKAVDASSKLSSPSLVNLYAKPACNTPIPCGPTGSKICTDLFQDVNTCLIPYTGTERRNP